MPVIDLLSCIKHICLLSHKNHIVKKNRLRIILINPIRKPYNDNKIFSPKTCYGINGK